MPETLPDGLPYNVLLYTLPSRYCASDVLGDEVWSRFDAHPPGYGRVREICRHVRESLSSGYGTSAALSTAADANAAGFGACRDFTHLAIGNNYATEVTHALAAWAFSQDVYEVFAVVRPGNTHASSTLRNNGMQWVGETTKYFGLNLQVLRLRVADLDRSSPWAWCNEGGHR